MLGIITMSNYTKPLNEVCISPVLTVHLCSSCRSPACAAMLMYDCPLKTDMKTVRHLYDCVNAALGACVCFLALSSCLNMFLVPYCNSDLDTHTYAQLNAPATCLDRPDPTFRLFLDKQAAGQWIFAYNGFTHCQAEG